MSTQPRPEYPRPILQRERWLNLNGQWRFQADTEDGGLDDQWYLSGDFPDVITVPFPIESEASGQHNLKPAAVNWYSRDFLVPALWDEQLLLHIGACDHWTRVFVNGQEVGQHRGGFDPIAIDISHALQGGGNTLVIRVEDSLSWTQPRGKQAGTTKWPIDYDTVSGIWQTVWLEPLPKIHIDAIHSEFNEQTSTLRCWVESNRQNDYRLEVELLVDGQSHCGGKNQFGHRAEAKVELDVAGVALWSPQCPTLHPLILRLYSSDNVLIDTVESYVGLRQVSCSGNAIHLNGEPIYLRGVLDQGYFEQGWYTAIDDASIKRDVELTLALGFNCARKHQKIEDPRYLYWADRLGLLVWEEMPSGRVFSNELVRTLNQEWMAVLRRDRQHPCIIVWVPFNESWGIWNQVDRPEQRAFVDGIVSLTKAQDQSRLVVGNDGWEFSSGDLWTLHLYEGESTSMEQRLQELMQHPSAPLNKADSAVGQKIGALPGAEVAGLPILLSEIGGIGYTPGHLAGDEFSYGDLPESEAQLRERFTQVAKTINTAQQVSGFVWTQLTDVQQEINGILYFDRRPKFAIEEVREIMLSIGASFKPM